MNETSMVVIAISTFMLMSLAYCVGSVFGLKDEREHAYSQTIWFVSRYRDGYKKQCDLRGWYRKIANDLCERQTDCMYCPYDTDKAHEKCMLGKLNDAAADLYIKEPRTESDESYASCPHYRARIEVDE